MARFSREIRYFDTVSLRNVEKEQYYCIKYEHLGRAGTWKKSWCDKDDESVAWKIRPNSRCVKVSNFPPMKIKNNGPIAIELHHLRTNERRFHRENWRIMFINKSVNLIAFYKEDFRWNAPNDIISFCGASGIRENNGIRIPSYDDLLIIQKIPSPSITTVNSWENPTDCYPLSMSESSICCNKTGIFAEKQIPISSTDSGKIVISESLFASVIAGSALLVIVLFAIAVYSLIQRSKSPKSDVLEIRAREHTVSDETVEAMSDKKE